MTRVLTSAAEAAGGFLDRRTSRRGFLARSAVVGAAFAVGPVRYMVRPGTAWASLQPSQCASGRCASGFTEFCCAVVGFNGCPHGSFVGGWWKAVAPTGSTFCNGKARYYVDCNMLKKQDCPKGSHCWNDSCNCWPTCHNFFTYKNCNVGYQRKHHALDGSWVVCRMVMCRNPCHPVFDGHDHSGASLTQPYGHCNCSARYDPDTSRHSSCTGCG